MNLANVKVAFRSASNKIAIITISKPVFSKVKAVKWVLPHAYNISSNGEPILPAIIVLKY